VNLFFNIITAFVGAVYSDLGVFNTRKK